MNRGGSKRELVFVYGTLKKGGGLHHYMTSIGASFKGNWATGPEYTMLSLNSYPGVVINGKDRIHGEIYSVPSLVRLDQVESVPYLYTRDKIMTSHGATWMYFLNDKKDKFSNRYARVECGWWNVERGMYV